MLTERAPASVPAAPVASLAKQPVVGPKLLANSIQGEAPFLSANFSPWVGSEYCKRVRMQVRVEQREFTELPPASVQAAPLASLARQPVAVPTPTTTTTKVQGEEPLLLANGGTLKAFVYMTGNQLAVSTFAVGDKVDLWPESAVMSRCRSFAVFPDLPAGLSLAPDVGTIYGVCEKATAGKVMFVICCDDTESRSVALLELNIRPEVNTSNLKAPPKTELHEFVVNTSWPELILNL